MAVALVVGVVADVEPVFRFADDGVIDIMLVDLGDDAVVIGSLDQAILDINLGVKLIHQRVTLERGADDAAKSLALVMGIIPVDR